MSAPYGEVFPDRVDCLIVVVPKFWTAPPPLPPAVLLTNVLSPMVAVFWLKTPPPSCAELPVKVLVVTDSVPLLSIAPPEVPVVAGEELPVNVLPATDSVPWL